eukprot:TRINITY_DN114850_c0_g1_i1.p1 TRINITY_DN114850_c0_g1~~TRINITY_DN114850_c0_g1_i1.p1  ORF type:complete len:329 (+),score=52.07 TRINITY_DN114850_c0_g1_i1:132-1118(+)
MLWQRCSSSLTGHSLRSGAFGSWRSIGALVNRPTKKPLSGAERGALERHEAAEHLRTLPQSLPDLPAPEGAVICRAQNRPSASAGSIFPAQIYPGHPHNFTPLRPIQPGFAPIDRAVRDIAWESRFDLLERRIAPVYGAECVGTPRREIQDGLVNGIRVRPVQNPYVRLKPAQKYRLNTWLSRDWKNWTPQRCYVRGSRRRYRLPEDITPYRDELGEWHPPRVSGRYKADMEKQYYMNSLPWVWSNDYFQGKQHFMDREPRGLKRWYKREFRKAQVAEALKRADQMIEEYRKERREVKRLSWVETIVLEFGGDQLAAPYVRQRRLPKM